jgi:hypothetical protein
MRKIFTAAIVAAAVSLTASAAHAQDSDTQLVTFEVQAINSLSMVGSPSLTILAANAGSAPTSVSAGATYSITTNEADRKITAQIEENMPSGVSLQVLLAAPNGASAVAVALSETAQDVMTSVSTLSEAGLSLNYTLSATAAAGVVAQDTRTVTYTIIAGS